MRIEIEIPPKEVTIRDGCQVALAGRGVIWKESCLGEKSKEIGVYLIHHGGDIKYVGKTSSPGMSFGMRLRREFQESASGGKHLYPKLSTLAIPPAIMVSFISSREVERLVRASGLSLGSHQAIEILETVLIQAYLPDFQRHHVKQASAYLKKLGFTQSDDITKILKAKPALSEPFAGIGRKTR